MFNINQIADFFIEKIDENKGDALTHLKLQKLLYFAWGWYLTLYKQQLFEECPEAWQYGPVFSKLYQRFKGKGNQPITGEDILVGDGGIEQKVQEFLDNIWDEYGQYSAEKLANMTHEDPAWAQARSQGIKFMPKSIVECYFQILQENGQKNQDLSDLIEMQNRDTRADLSAHESLELLKSIPL